MLLRYLAILLCIFIAAVAVLGSEDDGGPYRPSKKALGKRKARVEETDVDRPPTNPNPIEFPEAHLARAVRESRMSSSGSGAGSSSASVADTTLDAEAEANWLNAFTGDAIHTSCNVTQLLPGYLEERLAVEEYHHGVVYLPGDLPALDLDDLAGKHLYAANNMLPRRSARLQALVAQTARKDADRPAKEPKRLPLKAANRRRLNNRRPADDARTLKWLDRSGELRGNTHQYKFSRRSATSPEKTDPKPVLVDIEGPAKKKKKGGRGGLLRRFRNGTENPARTAHFADREAKRSDRLVALSFSLQRHATPSTTGWQGAQPPLRARNEIRRLYFNRRDAADLMPYIRDFQAVPYVTGKQGERSTFLVDADGLFFMFRSVRAYWLAQLVTELHSAHQILIGNDMESRAAQNQFAGEVRGLHLARIIGHQRQSSVAPYLTAWHRQHEAQVNDFLSQPVIQRIIGWVSNMVRLVWPGLAARCEAEIAWHREEYGIEPLFGLFWNFCLNAPFPNQRRIHTGPHVDFKNQIGVCIVLTYVTSRDSRYNHKKRGWIVLWEAGIYVELPPWTLVGYPSSLFYHFNIDVDQLQTVYTDDDVEVPIPENSTPYDDAEGRGSMVFFSQSTMRHGPVTGFDTLRMAAAAGMQTTTDYGDDAQAAFRENVCYFPIPEDIDDNATDYESDGE